MQQEFKALKKAKYCAATDDDEKWKLQLSPEELQV